MSSWKLVNNVKELKSAEEAIWKCTLETEVLAVKCEGKKLSRRGTLSILTIATRKQVFIIDVLKLDALVFENEIGKILENKSIKKIMFDCKESADALWHIFNIRLSGIMDEQLLKCIEQVDKIRHKSIEKRSRETEVKLQPLIVSIDSYKKEIDTHQRDSNYLQDIMYLKRIYDLKNKWLVRPVENQMLNFEVHFIKYLFLLYDTYNNDDEKVSRLQIASDKYCGILREIYKRTFDRHEVKQCLPCDFIPEKTKACTDTIRSRSAISMNERLGRQSEKAECYPIGNDGQELFSPDKEAEKRYAKKTGRRRKNKKQRFQNTVFLCYYDRFMPGTVLNKDSLKSDKLPKQIAYRPTGIVRPNPRLSEKGPNCTKTNGVVRKKRAAVLKYLQKYDKE